MYSNYIYVFTANCEAKRNKKPVKYLLDTCPDHLLLVNVEPFN